MMTWSRLLRPLILAGLLVSHEELQSQTVELAGVQVRMGEPQDVVLERLRAVYQLREPVMVEGNVVYGVLGKVLTTGLLQG